MSALEVFVSLCNTTDGRDKIYKTFAGLTKALGAIPTAPNAKAMAKVSKAIGDGRSLMRMGKWTSNIVKIQGYSDKIGSLTTTQMVEILRSLGDMGYVVGDNISWLAKYSVVSLSSAVATKYAKISQFWGFICALVLDVLKLSAASAKRTADAKGAAAFNAALLSLIKDLADTLAVLAAVGYAKRFGYNPSAVFIGGCSVVSGSIATYTNWNTNSDKVAKAAAEKKAGKKE